MAPNPLRKHLTKTHYSLSLYAKYGVQGVISAYTSRGMYCLYEEEPEQYSRLHTEFRFDGEQELGPKVIVEWSE